MACFCVANINFCPQNKKNSRCKNSGMLGQAVSKATSSKQGYNLVFTPICWYYQVFENPSFSALKMAAAAATPDV